MISELRNKFNSEFSVENYQQFLDSCNKNAGFNIPFRIAETPIFADKSFKEKVLKAGEEILSLVDEIKNNNEIYNLIPNKYLVSGEDGDIELVSLDFAITLEKNQPNIKLVELQGFPSLYAFENYIGKKYIDYFNLDKNYSHLFSDLDFNSYNKLLKEKLLGGYTPKQVILLEIDPWNQGTSVDFHYTEKYYGIKTVCLSKIKKQGKKLFYLNNGVQTEIKRIYNRIIIDELERRQDFINEFNFYDEIEAEWVVHPNWFVKCSKLMLPYLDSEYIPETHFLSEIDAKKLDLTEWVLKPIFSFSGSGVVFNITNQDIENITNPEQFIIQRKIKYEPIIPDVEGGFSKVELRMMYIRNDEKYIPVTNLARMTKGDLVGVKYNKNKTWVGGNIFLFEK